MHSSIEKILLASDHLPSHLKVIFEGLFKQNKPPEQICSEQQITMVDFENCRRQIAREMRASV